MTTPVAQTAPVDFTLRPAPRQLPPTVAGPRLEPKFEVDRYDADRYRLPALDARFEKARPQPREADPVRELITSPDAYSARPATMGPFGKRGAGWQKPAKGVSVGTDLGDGWRLDGVASPKHKGTLRVGLSRKF